MNDYMMQRPEMLAITLLNKLEGKKRMEADEMIERLMTLRCLSRDILLRLVANPEMVDAPAGALASRAVALAECHLAELGKVEKGEGISEEENMMQGALFGLFRRLYHDARQPPEGT